MGSIKSSGKKKKLASAAKHTRWAPFWIIPKIFGTGRRIHPSRVTRKRRRWRKKPRIRA